MVQGPGGKFPICDRELNQALGHGSHFDDYLSFMCRNIKTLHNFEPPATRAEVHASSLQFVRKLSGFSKPSKANEEAFDRAVEKVNEAASELLRSLVTNAPPRDREIEAAKARARSAERYGP